MREYPPDVQTNLDKASVSLWHLDGPIILAVWHGGIKPSVNYVEALVHGNLRVKAVSPRLSNVQRFTNQQPGCVSHTTGIT